MSSALALTLAQEQSHLLQAIAGNGGSTFNARGLQVYQANRAVLAERTLASTFPVLTQLIGAESFEPLARHFWQQCPPTRGDMGQWGAQLPEFLDAAAQLADEPFLGDVARIEWALHRAASAPDAIMDAPSFALLADDTAQAVGLVLSPGTTTLASAWPVVSIVNAHRVGQPTLDVAAELLGQGRGEHALVWRKSFKPMLRELSEAQYQVIISLKKGETLEAALDHASRVEATFDFSTWLGQAVQTGLITGAIQLPNYITKRTTQ